MEGYAQSDFESEHKLAAAYHWLSGTSYHCLVNIPHKHTILLHPALVSNC